MQHGAAVLKRPASRPPTQFTVEKSRRCSGDVVGSDVSKQSWQSVMPSSSAGHLPKPMIDPTQLIQRLFTPLSCFVFPVKELEMSNGSLLRMFLLF